MVSKEAGQAWDNARGSISRSRWFWESRRAIEVVLASLVDGATTFCRWKDLGAMWKGVVGERVKGRV